MLFRPRAWLVAAAAGAALVGIGIGYARADRRRPRPPRNAAVTYLPCSDESSLRSRASETTLTLRFENRTDGRVRVFWLDFDGNRVYYNALDAGQSYTQQTYVTHPWIVVDDNDRCIALLVPNEAGAHHVPIYPRP